MTMSDAEEFQQEADAGSIERSQREADERNQAF